MPDSTGSVYEWEDPDKYELLAWVKSSQRKTDILTSLADAPKNTNDFGDKWEVELETVRYHLNQLQQGGPKGEFPKLVQVLTPKRKRYRLYGLTEEGSKVVEML